MVAIRTLIHGALPPVGERVSLSPSPASLPHFPGFESLYVDSGTSALALALLRIKALRGDIENPEVIIPAYGCPDLVSAANFAGLTAVLVDIQADSPRYDVTSLADALSPRTVAVITVNFLGTGDDSHAIKALLPPSCYLVEDLAQCFQALNQDSPADFKITSFGRGKPVSLLGGGLLLVKSALFSAELQRHISPTSKALNPWLIRAYNFCLKPRTYTLVQGLPLLKLGETHYRELKGIHAMDPDRLRLLSRNIERRSFASAQTNTCYIYRRCATFSNVLPAEQPEQLLRVPILCQDRLHRDSLYAHLQEHGLGVSKLYQHPLSYYLEDLQPLKVHSQDKARRFADRLLTFPCHTLVGEEHLALMENLFAQYESAGK